MKTYIKIPFIAFGLVVLFFTHACSKSNCANSENGKLKNFTGLDGCGWIIVLDDGKNIEPINLSEFEIALIDGSKVSVRFKEAKNTVSVCMVGQIVEIECIKEN